MSDYGTMQARIASELRRTQLTDEIKSAIQTAIQLAEVDRYYFNEARSYTDTVADKAYYLQPTSSDGTVIFQNMESLTITVNQSKYPLDPKTFQFIDAIDIGVSNTGIPIWYAIYNNQFRLYPVPDDVYRLDLAYQRKLDTLTDGADTNAWMTDAETMIRQAAKAIVLRDVIRGQDAGAEAQVYDGLAGRARDFLVRETTRRVGTGHIQPSGYPTSRRHYW